eukprot:CAMPEP_0197846248 /NCGR_PEP_ID=MMETSP1438-20131217/3023_1 /TAXON_ID=1461541 /ORGANISM="Pterosperma sp., Strain CCMP1384" /LENGTH=138 /DNA_ID=CAMNT_0043457825 /DNA_START=404 /DNA_END=820 /DNA_ORIENTATION=-
MPFAGDGLGREAARPFRRTPSNQALCSEEGVSVPESAAPGSRPPGIPKPSTAAKVTKRVSEYLSNRGAEEPASATEKWLIGGVLAYALVVIFLAVSTIWYVLNAIWTPSTSPPTVRYQFEDLPHYEPGHEWEDGFLQG